MIEKLLDTSFFRAAMARFPNLRLPSRRRFCPICGKYARIFAPYGLSYRLDAGCPSCGSAERHRLTWLFLQRCSAFFTSPPRLFLHVAPEESLETKFRQIKGLRYVSTDLNAPQVSVKADLTRLPFASDSFDAAVCCHVLSHIPNGSDAMRELHRVLRPQGWVLLTTRIEGDVTQELPGEPASGLGWGDLGDSVASIYGMDITGKLEQLGFSVQVFRPPQFIQWHEFKYLRIRSGEDPIFLCTKDRPAVCAGAEPDVRVDQRPG